ncbi:MAG: hypothetical protein LBV20_05990 [Treponema sp.]|jgi:hypothetical protein|nr:hypothetical protein [Treponema sp.]
MAKISEEDRHLYLQKIKVYRENITAILAREKNILTVINKDTNGIAFKKIVLAEEMLNLASNYIIISNISQAMLNIKNEEFLNDGRKALYKAIIYMEDVVTNYIDVPFNDYEEKLKEIESFDAARRYLLVRKIGLAIELMEQGYGDNTKWKWSFVELEARFAAVAKNIFDLKSAFTNTDPRSPQYEPTVYHLRLMKKLLLQAADRYREKYELSTNRIDDFKLAISYLGSLKRIHILMGERDEAETIKKKQEIWSAKLEADIKKKEGK